MRHSIVGNYILRGDTQVSFALGTYDHTRPLVIDPTLIYSTYLGGSNQDDGRAIAVDGAGSTYIVGTTLSTNFPVINPFQPAFSGGNADAFVTKLNASGTAFVYSTYLGGNNQDQGSAIAVDSTGNAYVDGFTLSSDFPLKNPLQSTFFSLGVAFLAKLDPSGSTLIYSSYLGGSGSAGSNGIAVDSSGNVYLTGSAGANFPLMNPLFTDSPNPFVAKVNASGSALIYSTYLGGSDDDASNAITIDSAGDAYVTGVTNNSNDFPLQNPFQSTNGGNLQAAFVTKLNATGDALIYSTYLGGSSGEIATGIAVDSSGEAYVTGETSSKDFPLKNPLQPTFGGFGDVFVTKFTAAGNALVYSTYLGGGDEDNGTGIQVDSLGNAFIVGETRSLNFPIVNSAQAQRGKLFEAFVSEISASGSTLSYSTYLGGNSDDFGSGIALDAADNAYVTGGTASSNFPLVGNPFQSQLHGFQTAFVTKIASGGATFQINQAAVGLVTAPGASPGQQTLTLRNSSAAPLNWISVFQPVQPWVSSTPPSGTIASGGLQQITLTFNTPDTTPQVYKTNLILVDPTGKNNPLTIPITVVSANVSKTWYFAEGFTGGSFTEFLTLANPNSTPANVQVQYLLGNAPPITKPYLVGANARSTIRVNDEIGPNQDVSLVVTADQPIVAERPVYFIYTSIAGHPIPGGTDVLGATQLGTSFDFGYLDTSNLHDTYLTILNQNNSLMNVTIHYFAAATGASTIIMHTINANSRGTVKVNGEGLPAGVYSALVTLSLPGLVERPMYLVDGITHFTGSADVVGVTTPLTDWDFAEGFTSSGSGAFSERYLLSNPTLNVASVLMTFFKGDGSTQTTGVTIQPGAQAVVDANAVLGNGVNNSAHVHADQPILAERFMSFDFRGNIPGATDVLGAAQPSNLFLFSEGFTGTGFFEFLTIENPDPATTATVQVTFLPANANGGTATPVVQVYQVAPNSRFTLDTSTVMPGQSFSMIVESNMQIVAERPMYFTFTGGQTGGSDVVGYQP